MRRALPFMLALAACAPEPTPTELHTTVLSSVGEIMHPATVYVRFDEPKGELTVFEKLEGAQLAQGSAAAGTKLALTLEGRACELESGGPRTETETLEKNTDEVAPVREPGFRERQTKVISVTLRCADGLPPPGVKAPPSVPGWTVTLWLLGVIALGLALGVVHARFDSAGAAFVVVGVALLTAIATLAVSWKALDGGLAMSVPVLAMACGLAAFFAPLMASNNSDTPSRIAAGGFVVSAVAGPVIVSLSTPLWAGGAPLVAALVVLVGFAIFGAVSALGR